jgi:putative ABC transport system permease protein
MSWIRESWRRIRSLSRHRAMETGLDEEIRFHVDQQTEKNLRAGMSVGEARRQANIKFGGVERVKEDTRDEFRPALLEDAVGDLRYGVRALRRAPWFTLVSSLTLALGIGASVTVFSVARSVLWRPLPYPDSERIVIVTVDARGVQDAGATQGELLDLRAQSRLVDHISTIFGVDAHVSTEGEVRRVPAASVTDDVLPLLGAAPVALGRTLQAAQDDAASGMRVVISHELWRGQFGGDPAAVGRRVQINNQQMEIVGVLRPGLRVFLRPSTNAGEQVDVWFPTNIGQSRSYRGAEILGRLKPGVTLSQAQAEFNSLAARFVADHPSDYPEGALRLRVMPLREALTEDVRPALTALLGAVGFVLLIACVNVANLMLARNNARGPELAVRRALGASGVRITRQLFIESLVLAVLGGAAGVLAAYFGLQLVDWLRPVELPRQSEISMDQTVVIFAIGLSLLTSLAFGLLPALRHVRARRSHALTSARSQISAIGARRFQGALVVAEVALSIIPLVAAGLMLRSFVNLANAPIGFDPSNLQTAKISISFRQYRDVASRWRFHRDLLDRVANVPGIDVVTAASPLPFAPLQVTRRYARDEDENTALSLATQQTILPGYLQVTQTPLREGRDFTLHDIDTERPVVIVDERIASRLWPEGAIGKGLAVVDGQRRRVLEVVGVTNAVRSTSVRNGSTPHFFVPYHVYAVELSLVAKTSLSSESFGSAIERTLAALGTGRGVFNVRPMSEYVSDSISDTRFTMLVLVGFAGAALLLAALGLYATLAYLISQRTREIGVRMALGASVSQILGMVVREGVALTVIGAVVGLLGALAVTRTIQSMLYDVSPFDGLTLVAVAALVVVTATIAASRPAWRAARIDPIMALRSE